MSQKAFLFEQNPGLPPDTGWWGLARGVANDVGRIIARQTLEGRFWQPARLVRTVLDNKLAMGEAHLEVVRQTTNLAKNVYAGTATTEQHAALTEKLRKYKLLRKLVRQENDTTTMRATVPYKSQDAATRLYRKTNGAPILAIPMCHGGLVSGLQVALYYERMQEAAGKTADVEIYPVRFSRRKHHDIHPRITPTELSYVEECAQGRTVVLADEDTSSGRTIADAAMFFRCRIPAIELIGIANDDDIAFREQSEFWEWPPQESTPTNS